jgi:purine-nucleoside phosphorylase
MSETFDRFLTEATRLQPAAAAVLGSGLGTVVQRLQIVAECPFAEVPGFAAPTVHGHGGRVVLGYYDPIPVILFQGRMHYYEGHPWERVVATVQLAADLGARKLILTNAAGGLHPQLNPGDLMALQSHITLLTPRDWTEPTAKSAPYDAKLLQLLTGRGLLAGTYAALTGPCYETPAEIRALAALGADAVGMSTAREAEAGAARGMRVAAISCITNKAAGLSDGPLDHKEVLQNATGPAERIADLFRELFRAE